MLPRQNKDCLCDFQLTMMPFGLHRAAATLQRLVDTILSPCERFTLTYLDDIVFFSRTWKDHLCQLHQLLHCLQTTDLKVNPKKSKLGFTELEYLGYAEGGGQLKTQEKKVEAILQAASPRTKKQVQQFFGVVDYYSRFIPIFASQASH